MDYLTYPLSVIDKIEASFDEKKVIPWMEQHWHWSFYFSALYLSLIVLGQRYMKNKDPYNLRRVLCMWSTMLSAFSICALWRIHSQSLRVVYLGGWHHAICDTRGYIGSTGTGIWAFMFPFSKLPELVDTAFIVLRKQPLSFLHYYHHVTVFIYCWFSYAYPVGPGIWFGHVNFAVHFVMYAYYAVKASGRSPPRLIAKCITILQLSQMFVGIYLNYVSISLLLRNKVCATNWFAIAISIFFYASYAVLFANFFYWAYIHKKPRKNSATEKPPQTTTEMLTIVNGHSNGIVKSHISNGTLLTD